MRNEKFLLPLNFFIIYFVWGMTYIWMKTAVDELHPFVINFWQNFIAALALLTFNFNQSFLRFIKDNFISLLTQSFFMLILGVSFITISIQKLPASFAAVIISSVPIWVTLFNSIAEKNISTRNLIGVLMGLIGVAFLVKLEFSQYQASSHFLILLVAALSWSYGLFRMPKLSIINQPLLSSAAQMLIASIAYLLISLFTRNTLIPYQTKTIGSLLSLSILGSTVAFSSLNWLLKHSSPVKVATYAYINPIVSMIMAWLLLGETIKPEQVPYIALILLSVVIVVSGGNRKKHESN